MSSSQNPPLRIPEVVTTIAPLAARQPTASPLNNGVLIGVVGGILGLFVITATIVFLLIKCKRRPKSHDADNVDIADVTYSNGARLLVDSHEATEDKAKYIVPLDAQRSASCPDILQVNKSILLKLGDNAHAFEQLEQASVDKTGRVRYQSENYITAHTSLKDELNEASTDECNGKATDECNCQFIDIDESDGIKHLCKSITKKFRSHSELPTTKTKGNTKGLRLYVNKTDIPAKVDKNQNETNLSNYQVPTPTSSQNEDTIYDIPKGVSGFDQLQSGYTNLPAKDTFKSMPMVNSQENQPYNIFDRYNVPLNIVQTPRSYTLESPNRILQTQDRKLYESPSVAPSYEVPSPISTYYSQPSLYKIATEDSKLLEKYRIKNNHNVNDKEINGSTPYDIPCKVLPLETEQSTYPVFESRKVISTRNNRNGILRSDNNGQINDCTVNINDNKGTSSYTDGTDYTPESPYDVPAGTGQDNIHRSASLDTDNDLYKNITSTITSENKRTSIDLLKKLGYDVPSTAAMYDPSQPALLKLASKNLYKNIDGSPKHKTKNAASKTAYDGPTSIPLYDPSGSFSKTPKKESPRQKNRTKGFIEDNSDSIYDVPTNNKAVIITQLTPTIDTPEYTNMPSLEGDSGDTIYENVFQTVDGRQCIRSYTASH